MSISKTFCPAKWDEILVNLSANYVYSCCKSTPIQITKKEDINHALDQQRSNLLAGIQDPACDYCWRVENQGHFSLRQEYLFKMGNSDPTPYQNNIVKLKKVEVNLGNECNFQCTYCNPKFSSQWETDVKTKPYKLYSDRYFYAVDEKNDNTVDDTIEWLKTLDSIEILQMIGGEPTQNKNFFKIIETIHSKQLSFSTNLSCKRATIDRILALADRYQLITMSVSLDSTKENAEFSRYGMNYQTMLDNIQYLIANCPANVKIIFHSLMTSVTIRDFANIVDLIEGFHTVNPTVTWNLTFCQDPNILTLNTLPDKFKPAILEKINSIKGKDYIYGIEILEGAVKTSVFNKTMYGQLKYFLEEFGARKKLAVPIEL